MEGELWKWTNYWNGWQSRWFILSGDGVLSYYKSHDEVDQGCKGSMNVAACDIVVNARDKTRLDIIVCNEQYLYLKAPSEKERQKWLVALGSTKANFGGGARPSSSSSGKSPVAAELSEEIKSKRSELRLYCDLLMQQVHTVKQSVSAGGGKVNQEQLEEGCNLLSKTCDTFITTLDETVELVDSRTKTSRRRKSSRSSVDRSPTPQQSRISPLLEEEQPAGVANGFKSVFGGRSPPEAGDGSRTALGPHFPDASEAFIPALKFIAACHGVLKVFDFLGPSNFFPICLEIGGHVARLNTKIMSDSKRYENLLLVVHEELSDGAGPHSESASSSILWLSKYLQFVVDFLSAFLDDRVSDDDDDEAFLRTCLSSSYENVLRSHLTTASRNAFAAAIRSSPGRKLFLRSLTGHDRSGEAMEDLERYLYKLRKCVEALLANLDGKNVSLKPS